MDNKSLIDETVPKHGSDIAQDDHSQVQQPIRRELDSLDDFEHLQMGQESPKQQNDVDLLGLQSESPAGELVGIINKGVETAANAASKITDVLTVDPPKSGSKVDILDVKLDSNLLEMGDSVPDRRDAGAKLEKFLSEYSAPPVVATEKIEPPFFEKDTFRNATQDFMDMERGFRQDILDQPLKSTVTGDFLDRYSDSEPEIEEFKQSSDFAKKEPPAEFFKDIHEEVEPELPKRDYPEKEPSPVRDVPSAPPVQILPPKPSSPAPEPKKEPELPREPPKELKAEPVAVSKEAKVPIIEAEVMFCKMGLGEFVVTFFINATRIFRRSM